MNLRPEAREFFIVQITTTPQITAWEASFDPLTTAAADRTWVDGEQVGDDTFRWLVSGPDFDPTGQAVASSADLPLGKTVPLVRASDNPEVIYRSVKDAGIAINVKA